MFVEVCRHAIIVADKGGNLSDSQPATASQRQPGVQREYVWGRLG